MVIRDAGITLAGKILHNRQKTLLASTHAVRKLDHSLHRAVRPDDGNTQRQSVK